MSRLIQLCIICNLCFSALRAQDIIVTDDISIINAYHLEIGEQSVYYHSSEDLASPILRLSKAEILAIKKQDGTKIAFIEEQTQAEDDIVVSNRLVAEKDTTVYPNVNHTEYKGFLLEPGNRVYMPFEDLSECEKAVQMQLAEEVKKLGIWTIVDNIDKAHFVLEYRVDSSGTDTGGCYLESVPLYLNQNIRHSAARHNRKTQCITLVFGRADDTLTEPNLQLGKRACKTLHDLSVSIQSGKHTKYEQLARQHLTQ